QHIPKELQDAARVDGASFVAQIRHLTWPLVKPTTALLVLFGTIGALREFESVYILTGGGPGHSSTLLSIEIFNDAFTLFSRGYAAAIASIMLFIALVLAFVELDYARRTSEQADT